MLTACSQWSSQLMIGPAQQVFEWGGGAKNERVGGGHV